MDKSWTVAPFVATLPKKERAQIEEITGIEEDVEVDLTIDLVEEVEEVASEATSEETLEEAEEVLVEDSEVETAIETTGETDLKEATDTKPTSSYCLLDHPPCQSCA
jgi:hypothetical protein